MTDTKTEHAKVEETTTARQSGPDGSARAGSHSERTQSSRSEAGTPPEAHPSGDAEQDLPAEVDASMPPGGAYG